VAKVFLIQMEIDKTHNKTKKLKYNVYNNIIYIIICIIYIYVYIYNIKIIKYNIIKYNYNRQIKNEKNI